MALGAACLLGLVMGCSPTEGEDGFFDPTTTTNTDFNKPEFVAVGNNPITMDTADYEPDGDLDIVVVNLLDGNNAINGSISLLTNDGAGNFSETRTAVGPQASTVFFGNLNGAGNLDIAVLVNEPVNPLVWICFDPAPACASTVTVSLPNLAARMEMVDLDQAGGAADLLLTSPNTSEIVALVNDGAGTFTLVSTSTTTIPGKFTSGEFDGVGNLDVVTMHTSANLVTFWSGDGAGNFSNLHDELVLDDPTNVVRLDSSDGLDDVAVTIDLTQIVTMIVTSLPATAFSTSSFGVGPNPEMLLAGSFDGEPEANDVLVMNRLQQFFAAIQGTDGTPPTFTSQLVPVSRDPFAAVAGDFTPSAFQDAAVLEKEDRVVSILESDGGGNFSRTVIGLTATPTFPVVVPPGPLSLSGSSKADLLLLQPFSDRVVILKNSNP